MNPEQRKYDRLRELTEWAIRTGPHSRPDIIEEAIRRWEVSRETASQYTDITFKRIMARIHIER